MKKLILRKYYFITDNRLSKRGNLDDVKKALSAGVAAVQYRNKIDDIEAMVEEAKEIKKLCDTTAIPFIINDDLEVALAVDADGLHIGQSDIAYHEAREALGNEKIIGVSASTFEEAMIVKELAADYIGLGPIFETATKPDAKTPCGVRLIHEVRRISHVPVVAIGGITLENADEVIENGADSLCAISAVVTSDDVAKEIQKFNVLFRKDRQK